MAGSEKFSPTRLQSLNHHRRGGLLQRGYPLDYFLGRTIFQCRKISDFFDKPDACPC